MQTQMPAFDQAFAALIRDLDRTGLLDRTLVMVSSEFGRTPKINKDAGRDHWPKVFSVVLAGGGIKKGYIHGASNATATEPERDPIGPEDLATTVYHQLGIVADKELMAPGNRPIEIVDGGKVRIRNCWPESDRYDGGHARGSARASPHLTRGGLAMKPVILDPDQTQADRSAERRRLGGDRYDEVWDGVYVMSPDRRQRASVTRRSSSPSAFDRGARPIDGRRGLPGVQCQRPTRVNWKKNYRCPDVAVFLPGQSGRGPRDPLARRPRLRRRDHQPLRSLAEEVRLLCQGRRPRIAARRPQALAP